MVAAAEAELDDDWNSGSWTSRIYNPANYPVNINML